jgi:predicted N-acetyltransferase YhbS
MGAGVGTLLFEHAVQTVRSMGGSIMNIVSDPHAEGFYRRMGASRAGHVPSRIAGRLLPLMRLVIE